MPGIHRPRAGADDGMVLLARLARLSGDNLTIKSS